MAKQIHIRLEDSLFEALSEYADKEANPLYPVPMLMDAKELEEFYFDVAETKKANVVTIA